MDISFNTIKFDQSNQLQLFVLLKEKKYNTLAKLLIKNKSINLNIVDKSGNYFIIYPIIFNEYNLLQLCLRYNVSIDFIDNDGYTCMFYPIKFGFNRIANLILAYSKKQLSDIANFQDRYGNTAIFYTIYYNNFEIFKELFNYEIDLTVTVANNYNIIHMIVFHKREQFLTYLLELPLFESYRYLLNNHNGDGESPLHLACNFELLSLTTILLKEDVEINDNTNINNISPIMYGVLLNNYEITDLILDYYPNINLQDINGNTVLHHAVSQKNPYFFKRLKELDYDYDITNINGETVLHLVLKTITELDDYDVEELLEKTNINIQDNNGDTILHILVRNKLWLNYKNILSKKRINIYVLNGDDKKVIEMIPQTRKEEFKDMIIDSYFNTLISNQNEDWLHESDNTCKVLSINNKKCRQYIEKQIYKNIQSYPKKRKADMIEIEFEKENVNIFSPFIGITLDVLMGMLFIHNEIKTYSSVSLYYETNPNYPYYTSEYELTNFEIIWHNQQIYFPSTLSNKLEECVKEKKYRFFMIPISIIQDDKTHANMIIIDLVNKEIERFEPNGSIIIYEFNYNPQLLDVLIIDFLKIHIGEEYMYYKPEHFLPKIGIQMIESNKHIKEKIFGDATGYCAGWILFYARYRVFYPDYDRKELYDEIVRKIKESNLSFKAIIRNFVSNIVRYRDRFLSNIKKTINDWYNERIDSDSLTIFKKTIKLEIEKVVI